MKFLMDYICREREKIDVMLCKQQITCIQKDTINFFFANNKIWTLTHMEERELLKQDTEINRATGFNAKNYTTAMSDILVPCKPILFVGQNQIPLSH